MLRRSVCIWCSVVVVTICSVGYAQIGGLPVSGQKDYYAAIIGSPTEAQEVRDLEHRHLREALLYMRQGKPRDAIRNCMVLLERFANHPKGFVILGMAARLIKEPFLPIPYFERALQMYPAHAMTHAQYGKYLAEIGKSAEGVKRLHRAVEINPHLHVAYTWLARVYVQQGQRERARQILQRGREAEALPSQGIATGADPMTEIFSPGEGEGEGTRDENMLGGDSLGTTPRDGTSPMGEQSEGRGVIQ